MAMRLKAIGLHNFGPYYGDQTIGWGDVEPIVLIHAANMRGKTSFLNAIRWALYGHARDRLRNNIPLIKLINTDAAAQNDWTMSVEMSFEVDGQQYQLTRATQPKDPSIRPHADSDFEENLFVKRGSAYLNRDDAQREINRILPEQIARFFLFDGELLNDYENLLGDVGTQASTIKESIEHILGVPALLNGMADLRLDLRDAARRQQKQASKVHAAKALAENAARLDADIDSTERDLGQLRLQRDELAQKQRKLDDVLQETSGYEADVQRLDVLQREIDRLTQENARFIRDRREKLPLAWRDLVQPRIRNRLEEIEDERDELLQGVQRAGELHSQIQDVENLLETGRCPVCNQDSREEHKPGHASKLQQLQEELTSLQFDPERLEHLGAASRKLRQLKAAGVVEAIAALEESQIRNRVVLVDMEVRRDELNHRLQGHDQASIARNRREHNQVTKELGALEDKILNKQRALDETQEEAARNRAAIRRVAGPDLERLNREVQIYEEMLALFRRAVDKLRDDLRKTVERDATKIFLELTTDKSYTGLRINDHYGLTIIDANGSEVQVRSAGAEQIVALSLIGALNQNAVRRGPIVMDTPFGRLDPGHRENILKFVPSMADQVTLLVHGGEVDRDRDLKDIRKKIDREYTIEYVSSSRSQLTRLDGS